jgi:hypothetical protein
MIDVPALKFRELAGNTPPDAEDSAARNPRSSTTATAYSASRRHAFFQESIQLATQKHDASRTNTTRNDPAVAYPRPQRSF